MDADTDVDAVVDMPVDSAVDMPVDAVVDMLADVVLLDNADVAVTDGEREVGKTDNELLSELDALDDAVCGPCHGVGLMVWPTPDTEAVVSCARL